MQIHQNKYINLDVQCTWTIRDQHYNSNMIIEEIKFVIFITIKDAYNS